MRNRKYIVDLNSKTYQVARYKQYDNNINYSIEVIEDGVLVDLDNCIVKAFFETPSKLILQKDCMVSDNTITTILDNNILGEAGKVLVEFTIYKSDIIVTTFTLSLDVEKSINKNDAIQKEPVWDIIANLLEIDETVRIKLEEVDNKIIETTEITNTNTSKIDNKILDIQNQLDSRISEKFTEIDNTLESKTTEKFIAVDEILNEKQTQIQEQVDNKISDADNKILDCEERMQNIESNFGDLVDGTGYATTEFVNRSLEQKSNIDHRHNISEIDDLNMNAEDISMSDGSNVEENVYRNKENIQYIKNEFSKTENTSYTTANGIKEFECKDGYVDNVVIEGETLVNIVSMVVVNGADSDGVVRTRFSNLGDNYKFYPRTQKGTFTLMNHTDKSICFVGMTSSDIWASEGFYVEPLSARVVTLDGSRCINGVDFQPSNGWSNSDLYIYKSSMYSILEGEYDYMPYFEGLKSVGQGDKIEVLTRGVNIFDGLYESGVINSSGILAPNDLRERTINYILVEPNTKYYTPITTNVYQYDYNKNFVGHIPISGGGVFTTSDNTKYIKFYVDKGLMGTLQINKGEAPLPYQKPIQDKKQILTTLRSLPNGVKDTIEKRGNKYYKIKRCEEIVIDNNLEITGTGVANQILTRGQNYALPNLKRDLNSPLYCNCLKVEHRNNETLDEEHIINLGDGRFRVRALKSKLSSDSLEGSSAYWNSIKPTIVYELETPIIEELPNFNPQTFEGNTTLLLNSGVVQAEASFEVTNSLGSELEVLKGKVSDLDNYVADKEVYYPTLLNGWVKSTTSYGALRFERQGKLVTVNCRIKSGTTTSGTIIAQLPSRFIATEVVVVPCFNGKAQSGRVFFTEVGYVTIFDVGSNTDLYFNFSYYVK